MSERYENDLWREPAEIVGIKQKGVPVGPGQKRTEPGFVLSNGTVLLESEKDENGFYIGGAGIDGTYLSTLERYEPVRNDGMKLIGFRQMSRYTVGFKREELALIYSYALNTKENLIEDLTAVSRRLKPIPEVYSLYVNTVEKLKRIPSEECRKLMADVYAVWKSRHMQDLHIRQQKAHTAMEHRLESAAKEAGERNVERRTARAAAREPER